MFDHDDENGNEPVEHDYTHPERHFANLAPDICKEWQETGWRMFHHRHEPLLLCWACGWSTQEQDTTGYSPRVRIMYARDNMGMWSIGSKWLIKDEPKHDWCGNDYLTWKFLKEQPGLDMPLVEKMIPLSDPQDSLQFTLISRVQGKTLASVWPKCSAEQKAGYRDQMVEILKRMRQVTAPFPQKINGDKLDDCILANCRGRAPPTCFKIGYSMDEWLEGISETIRGGLCRQYLIKDEKVIEEKLQQIKDNFPRGDPYVLTHGDFNLRNIMVKDDKIIAILDWETAGFYPWWAEKYCARAWTCDQEELFEGIWDRVCPELEDGPAWEVLSQALVPIRRAIRFCQTTHNSPLPPLYRAPFCKCRPDGQKIKSVHRGAKNVHEVVDWRASDFDPASWYEIL
ncbi:hypothetical protein CLAIMM_02116 [Cladophialophora immunda]|nr:hypothetical protein CLAIMM_02116 [Cladophialophora immunda]